MAVITHSDLSIHINFPAFSLSAAISSMSCLEKAVVIFKRTQELRSYGMLGCGGKSNIDLGREGSE